jgi:hypothetical protein
VEIKLGIRNVPREVTIEATQSVEEVKAALKSALSETNGVLELSDEKGRLVLVPVQHLAYLDVGQEFVRPVGFGTV